MPQKTIRRFYKKTTCQSAENGYAILLDGRSVKTPHARVDLVVPTRPLADAVAEEWDAQGENVRPERMPLTALVFTAHDIAGPQREGLIEGIVRYADTELVCYHVEQPQVLVERQQALWQPLLDWIALSYDARLNTTTGILPIEQPAAAKSALAAAVETLDPMRLAALSSSVRASGSIVVGLALAERKLDAETAFETAELERTYQIEQWGEDVETTRDRDVLKRDLSAAEQFLALLAA